MTMNGLYDNCHKAWPEALCGFGNVCGYISNAIWFVVLVPQIWKNWKRRSVEGLSILWASANFTGSLVNCFFVFSDSLPLYIKISAVYMPILEFSILVQFLLYSKHTDQMKVLYGMGCFLVWIAVIVVELSVENVAPEVQWIAIALWSVESFPQVCCVYYFLINLVQCQGFLRASSQLMFQSIPRAPITLPPREFEFLQQKKMANPFLCG